MTMRKLTAVFDSPEDAQRAQQRLLELGLPQEHINIIDQSSSAYSAADLQTEPKGFWASIKDMFVPDEEDRVTFEESVRRGSYLLIAQVDDNRADQAIQILESANAVDLDQRREQWRAEGWPDGTTVTTRESADLNMARNRTAAQAVPGSRETEEAIPIVREQLRVGKREVNRGSVRVRSFIVEEPVHEEVRLRQENVEIERRPVNEPARPVAAGSPGDLLQERTIEVSETAEEAVVGKEAVVTEEVRVRKHADERVEQIDETVRHTEVDVEDTRGPNPATSDRARRKPRGDATRRPH